MAFDPFFYALAVPVVIFMGISKGGFGDVATFAATPILALAIDPGLALGLVLPLLMVMDVGALRAYRGRWHGPSVRVLVLGAVPGVGLGLMFFTVADPDHLRLAIGALALAYVGWQAARALGWVTIRPRPFDARKGVAAGATGGFTSFVAHAGGPPVAMFLLGQGMDKTTYQATSVATFAAFNLFKLVPYAMLGIFTAETLVADLVLMPVAAAGIWLGVKAHRLVPERAFFAVTFLFLAATGARLVWLGMA
ncbi:MAG: sulfite exporter TauE/SafE family protein [Rhodobacteraceae bacterium]|jgi:uncharacterized membrane protein YfcA|nr:sulfite exporter TauE/SafE family protein [Paracoccaceae bacterium]